MGRKKIEITFVKDPSTRQVTFSKRRTGLFKKANELSILCGAEVAIVMFSPGNKPYSFGHPCVDAVAAKFLQQEPNPNDDAQSSTSSDEISSMDTLNQELADLLAQISEGEKKALKLDEALKSYKANQLSDSVSELKELRDSCLELKHLVKTKVSEIEVLEILSLLSQQKVAKKRRMI